MEMRIEEPEQKIKELCGLFGKTKQAYYQRISYEYQENIKEDLLIQKIQSYRKDLPRSGGRKLKYLLDNELPKELRIGRDKLFKWLAENNLLVTRKRTKIYTTNSHHWLHKYPNLIKDLTPVSPNQLWVSDITYIKTDEGVMYLFLITDAYSKKILGWNLSDNLKAENAVNTLKMALKQYENTGGQLIHHSDRGVQYCSAEYVKILQAYGIAISMTQDGNPLDNAIAERINGILKDEWLNHIKLKTKRSAKIHITRIVNIYNNIRPHMSLNMLTPQQVHHNLVSDRSPKRLWKNYYQKEQFSYCQQGVP